MPNRTLASPLGALRQYCPFACLGFILRLAQSLDADYARKAWSWAEGLSSWERLALEKPTAGGIYRPCSLQLGGRSSLLEIWVVHVHAQHTSTVCLREPLRQVETCHSSCWRGSLSDAVKGISRTDLSEDAWGTSCQSLLPPQSHGVPVTMQEFPRTIPQGF